MSVLPISGLHHLRVPVIDLERTRRWLEPALDLAVETQFRDDSGTVCGVAYQPLAGLRLTLRADPARARSLLGFDWIALAVRNRSDLDVIADRLDQLGVAHQPVVEETVGWVLAATGPDELRLRFYASAPDGGEAKAAGQGAT